MTRTDYENILKYMKIYVYVNGEMTDDSVMESLTQDGDFERWLDTLRQTRLEDGVTIHAPFYVFKRGKHLHYDGINYVIEDMSVEFYTDYPNPGGYPVVIVKLYLTK